MPEVDLQEASALAQQLARQAGALILSGRLRGFAVETKTGIDLVGIPPASSASSLAPLPGLTPLAFWAGFSQQVTEVDKACESLILGGLCVFFPLRVTCSGWCGSPASRCSLALAQAS